MLSVAVRGYAYESDLGDETRRGLSGGLTSESTRPEPDWIISKRARRKMSYAMWLSAETAARCARGIVVDERIRTPVFFGCPSGVEITVPFLGALRGQGDLSSPQLHSQLIGGDAGNVLEYLKYSVGNTPGHVAEHSGLRGMNACFTGFDADFSALRKAYLLLSAGVIKSAVVVAGEARADTESSHNELQVFGCAIHLVAEDHIPATTARLRMAPHDRDEPRSVSEPRARKFEACNILINLLWALETKSELHTSTWFHHEDRTGRPLRYGLEWGGPSCAA